jgi:hypothetical protein
MSYSSNPLLPKVRAQAIRLVVEDNLPVATLLFDRGNYVAMYRYKVLRPMCIVSQISLTGVLLE